MYAKILTYRWRNPIRELPWSIPGIGNGLPFGWPTNSTLKKGCFHSTEKECTSHCMGAPHLCPKHPCSCQSVLTPRNHKKFWFYKDSETKNSFEANNNLPSWDTNAGCAAAVHGVNSVGLQVGEPFMVTGGLGVKQPHRNHRIYSCGIWNMVFKNTCFSIRLRTNPFDEWIFGIFGGFVCLLGIFLEFLKAINWNSKSLEIAGHYHLKVRSSESDFGNLTGFWDTQTSRVTGSQNLLGSCWGSAGFARVMSPV